MEIRSQSEVGGGQLLVEVRLCLELKGNERKTKKFPILLFG